MLEANGVRWPNGKRTHGTGLVRFSACLCLLFPSVSFTQSHTQTQHETGGLLPRASDPEGRARHREEGARGAARVQGVSAAARRLGPWKVTLICDRAS